MHIPFLRTSSNFALLALSLSLFASPGRALAAPSGDASAAANAYEQGQRAELGRDHLRAAEMFELADSLVASPEALRAAIKNYEMAGRPDRAASLAWALGRRYNDSESRDLSASMLEGLTQKLLTVEIDCDTPCTISSEGKALSHVPSIEHKVFLQPGRHELEIVFGKELIQREEVEGEADQVTSVSAERPPEPEQPDPDDPATMPADRVDAVDTKPRRARLSPAWFIVGAVATAGAGGALIWSGNDVVGINDEYEADPTRDRLNNGQDAERRTNALIGVTAGLGVVTVVLATLTDWGRWSNKGQAARGPVLQPVVWTHQPGGGLGGRF